MTGDDGFPDLPGRTAGTRPPVRFDCPACGESLRMRSGSAGRAIDCPACGTGLILTRDAAGAGAAKTLGGDRAKSLPWLPLVAGGVGLGCAAAAGWLVLSGDPPAGTADPPPLPQVVAEAPADGGAEPAEPESAPVAPPGAAPVGAAPPETPAEPPLPPAPPEPVPPPVRPPVVAPGPSANLAARRVARRLDAVVGLFVMTKPAPLALAVEPLEDLLRVRIAVEAGRTVPVLVEVSEPAAVRDVLTAMAEQARVRVIVDGDRVRLVAR